MRDDTKNVATTEENQVPMQEPTIAGDRTRPQRDRRQGSQRTTAGSTSHRQRMSLEQHVDGVAGGSTLSTMQRMFANGRAPLIWGVLWGLIQAAAPLGLWWLDPATVYALSLALIAAVYVGFAVADGRPTVIAVETIVASAFVVLAAAGVTGSAWLLVLGFACHGLKDWWQHRSQFVANTRWWPPFCMTIDWVAAGIIAVAILSGVMIHQ